MKKQVVLGLGSNIGNRLAYLDEAICLLEEREIITGVIESQIYETSALLKEGAPKEWDINFYNMAIMGETNLSPRELLAEVKKIEVDIGRESGPKWAPREIDIDILLYGNEVYDDEILSIPHQEMLDRDFVMMPLLDLVPGYVYPREGLHEGRAIAEIMGTIANDNEELSLNAIV